MKKTYFDFLRETFASEDITPEDIYLLNIVYFYNLLCALLGSDLLPDDKNKVNAALAYLVSPLDAFPEDVYGIRGYADDLFVMCIVLKYFYRTYPKIVRKLWSNDDEDVEELLGKCYSKSKEFLDKNGILDKTLKYAGLEDV